MLALAILLSGPWFTDGAAEAGLDVVTYCGGATKDHILESTGNGVLVLDYDEDGAPDLFFVNAHRFTETGANEPHTSVLYRNRGDGTFEDVTERAGVETSFFGQGGAVGDVDGDGQVDLYLTAFGDDVLFRNNGDGTFSDWTARAGIAAPGWSIGASFFDADGDGDLDLFVGRYLEASWEEVHAAKRTRRWRGKVEVLDGPKGLVGARNLFFENDGDGTFTEATEAAGFGAGSDYFSMGVLPFDYDGDGDVDLVVANDSSPNCLYRNRGDGTFEEVGVETGLAYSADGNSQGSMGIAAGDVDGDGFLDLAVTNFAHDYYSLYRNLGGELFIDDSFETGVALTTFAPLGWGALLVDVDHDADLDLFFSNGQIYPQVDDDASLGESYRQKNQLFLNEGGRFRDASAEAGPGFEIELSSRGAAAVDVDDDGDLDIVVSNEDAAPSLLLNGAASGNWLSLDLRSDGGSLGAKVFVTAAGRRQMRSVVSGGSYASENDRRLHFGLGAATAAERVEIRWPDGSTESYAELSANRRYVVKPAVRPIELP